MVDFGKRLKALRTEAKMTQQNLAAQIGVTKSVVSYYELNERLPSPEVIIKMAAVFHVSADYLLGMKKAEDSTVDVSGLDSEDIRLLNELAQRLRDKKA